METLNQQELSNNTTPVEPQSQTAEMTPPQAIGLLIQGIDWAQSKGVFSLEDAELLSKAKKVFVKKEAPKADAENTEVPEAK